MFAQATSLFSVFDGVGGAQEIAGAMASVELMPFAGQQRVAQLHVKVLRVAEVLTRGQTGKTDLTARNQTGHLGWNCKLARILGLDASVFEIIIGKDGDAIYIS